MVNKADVRTCYHCGENCVHLVNYNGLSFCCQGCVAVYELLEKNELDDYYSIEQSPGKSFRNTFKKKFDYLNEEEITLELAQYSDKNTVCVTFRIPHIHCYSCVYLLEQLYRLNSGINKSSVNYRKKEISISYNPNETNLGDVVSILAEIGYEPDIKLSDLSNRQNNPNRRLLYQVGVAGFCFGNIMLLSFPEYISGYSTISPHFKMLFGYLSLVLSIPCLFYSGIDYLKSGFSAVRSFNINMDVPISLGMITLIIVSSVEIIFQIGSGYLDSLSGLIFFLLVGKIFQNKAFDNLNFERDFKSYLPISYTVLNSDRVESVVSIKKLQKGTRLLLKKGEIIPADCILLSSSASIDFSFVTGESASVRKVAGEIIFAGGKIDGSPCEVELVKEVSYGYLMSLWSDSSFGEERTYRLEDFTSKLSFWFTIIVLLIALIASIYWSTISISKGLIVFTSVLIIACPCALALSIPFALGNAVRLLARHKLFIKNHNVIHQVTKTDSIVFDKTGTLTSREINHIEFDGPPLSNDQKDLVYSLLQGTNHSLASSILAHTQGTKLEVKDFIEFDGLGIQGLVKRKKVRIGTRKFLGLPKSETPTVTEIWVEINNRVVGCYQIRSKIRPGIVQLLSDLKNKFKLSVLSGDNKSDYNRMKLILGGNSDLYFEQTPHSKLEVIKSIQDNGGKVLMIGDGLNDAGALSKSDVGIAVTEDVGGFTPASDIIMDVNMLPLLPSVISFCKRSVGIVFLSFAISILYNLVGIFFAVQGLLSPVFAAILMPLSSFTVVLIAMLGTFLAEKLTLKSGVLNTELEN